MHEIPGCFIKAVRDLLKILWDVCEAMKVTHYLGAFAHQRYISPYLVIMSFHFILPNVIWGVSVSEWLILMDLFESG